MARLGSSLKSLLLRIIVATSQILNPVSGLHQGSICKACLAANMSSDPPPQITHELRGNGGGGKWTGAVHISMTLHIKNVDVVLKLMGNRSLGVLTEFLKCNRLQGIRSRGHLKSKRLEYVKIYHLTVTAKKSRSRTTLITLTPHSCSNPK